MKLPSGLAPASSISFAWPALFSRTPRLAALAVAFALVPACASAPAPGPPAATASIQALPDGHARLDRHVVPRRYRLDVAIDPTAGTVRGDVAIDVVLDAPSDVVLMHAEGLTITAASATRGGDTVTLDWTAGDNGLLALRSSEPLVAGEHRLDLAYHGALPETPVGLYRVAVDGRWYAFTQFEPLEARRAFPCFDQPDFKTPFETTMTVPAGMIGVTNGLETERADTTGGVTFRFAPTQPLPTYLVAFVVGDFDVVDGPDVAPGVPFRVLTVKGRGYLAGFALDRGPATLAWLAEWFGSPYPYDKLDFVAVPNFSAGAMENVGLVTYREELLLVDKATAPVSARRRVESIIAHELAHMWFGNLVTPMWWDDLWLNEAFATWMAAKSVTALTPELEMEARTVAYKQWVMGLDAKASARAIRQPITTGGDIYNAFDGITYTKGQSVLHMLERWLGETPFQEGVRAYLAAHAHGNAVTADLLGALERASDKPVREVVARFLEQPGTPLVDVAVACSGDAASKAVLTLTQRRWKTSGSPAPDMPPWRVPVCLRYAVGDVVERECVLLEAAQATHTLKRPGCPAWLAPNDDEAGYYRWHVEDRYLRALTGDAWAQLTLREQVALPGHLHAQLTSGALDVGRYAEALRSLAEKDPPLLALGGVVDGIAGLHRLATTPAATAAYERLVTSTLRPLLGGTKIDPTLSLDERERRPALISALATYGRDAQLAARAREVAVALLTELDTGTSAQRRVETQPDMVALYLPLATSISRGQDVEARRELHRRLVAAVPAARTPTERQAIVSALAAFPEPELLGASLDLVRDGVLLAQDFRAFRRGGREPAAIEVLWTWMTANFDALVARLGAKAAPHLPFVVAGMCSREDAARVAAFFEARAATIPGGLDRNLAQTLESIEACAALREAHGAAFEAWLEGVK